MPLQVVCLGWALLGLFSPRERGKCQEIARNATTALRRLHALAPSSRLHYLCFTFPCPTFTIFGSA
jgi:hypothetical protein